MGRVDYRSFSLSEEAVELGRFLGLVHDLTGTPVKPLKPNERDALAKAIRDDGRQIDCSQLNELLLLVNKDRVERPFFEHFFPKDLTVATLPLGVERFQREAMLCYGNFAFAYRQLARARSAEDLGELLEDLGPNWSDLEDSFKRRSPKILEIDPIARDQTYLIGYLSARQITDDHVYAELLHATAADLLAQGEVTWDAFLKRVAELSKDRDRPHLLSLAHRHRASNKDEGVKEFASVLENAVVPELKQRLKEVADARQRASDNQDIYLTWDHMDVYFVSQLMGMTALAELHLRYFDPTQSFTASRVDKGLVEALMLKRAKCTVYSVQDTDTLGKDSELAATLAQGKPVLAYVPSIDVEQRAQALSKEDPTTIQDRLSFLAYADTGFAASLGRDDLAFVRGFKELQEFEPVWNTLPDIQLVRQFRERHGEKIDRLCRILAVSEKRLYDGRAATLKDVHPLGLQVHLETGVAQGVLVVRSIPECAELLRRILTNKLEFIVENNARDKIWYLKERISGCAYRVVTQDVKLTNCYWNYYGRN
jgi:hypothetical protein